MQRSDVVWSQGNTQSGQVVMSAYLTDMDGVVWEATIINEVYSSGRRLSVTLLCNSIGKMYANNLVASIGEAQEWCYATLGIV